jgi:hypothetical protein
VPDWRSVIGQATYAYAILDRLVHNAHRIELPATPCAKPAPPPQRQLDEKAQSRPSQNQPTRHPPRVAASSRHGVAASNRLRLASGSRWSGPRADAAGFLIRHFSRTRVCDNADRDCAAGTSQRETRDVSPLGERN